ncbi:ABC transporter permease [Pendulispora albinea]|uniref:FtsX-like permease family protein n=1 Tax=Pendulispora albinea TaxID=2741071 RepID=A0ABZ2LY40_9BACT
MSALLAHAAGAVWRRRGKAGALGCGLALTVALMAAILFLTDALRAEASRARAALPDVLVQRLLGGRPALLRPEDVKKLDGIDAVREVRARVWGYLFVPALQGNVTVIGAPSDLVPLTVAGGALDSGRDLAPAAHEMIAGTTLVKAMGLVVGDEMQLPSAATDAPSLRLVGTFSSVVDLYTADVIVMSDEDARAALGLGPDDATDVAVTLTNPAEARIVARTILERLPGARVIERDLLDRVYALAYGRRAGIVLAASIPALLALLILAWDRATGLGPEERREIAVLKAVGFATSDVLWVKLFEALLVGTTATVVGLLGAYLWVFVLGAPGLRPALVGFGVLYPEAPLTPEVDLTQLVAIVLGVLAPFIGLNIVPAWRAASMDPMDAMRS